MTQIISILIAILSIQTGASAAKQLFPMTGAIGATSLRISLAALLLTLFWRPWRGKRLTSKEISGIVLYGSSLGVMNLLFYLALQRIPLGITVALEFVGPLSVALAASRQPLDFLWASLALLGIFLILPLSQASSSLDPIGVFFALGAGCGWALYILFGQKVGNSVHGGKAATLGMWVATLIVLPIGIFQSGRNFLSPQVLPLALFVAIFSSALPYSLEMYALKKIPAKTFSILMSLEPAVASLLGLLFLKEHLSFTQWLAIACVIVASAGSATSIREKTESPSLGATV